MQVLIDLRYTFPPLLNLIWFFLFVASQNEPSFDLLAGALIGQQVSTMMLGFLALFVAIILMVIFLFFSVEFPLTPHPISLKARGISIALFISLLASFFFPPSSFWVTYLFIILTVPWHNRLFHQFIRFFRYFSLTIQSIPTIVIYTTQNNVHENPAQAPPPPPQVLELEV
ncbi:hypothetical protein Gotur_015035 [Gossypium turneri]